VQWSVNDVPGGNSIVGTITSNGTYLSPAGLRTSATYTIKATSSADASKYGSAAITVLPRVTISLNVLSSSVALLPGQTYQFHAAVTGPTDTSVTWSAQQGAIDAAGLYRAPAGDFSPDKVTATSNANPRRFAAATVTQSHDTAVLVDISPSFASAGELVWVTLDSPNASDYQLVFTGRGGMPPFSSPMIPLRTASQIPYYVPPSAVTAPVFVRTKQFDFITLDTNTLPFTRVPTPLAMRLLAHAFDNMKARNEAVNMRVTLANYYRPTIEQAVTRAPAPETTAGR
jgi:hypothetical protein